MTQISLLKDFDTFYLVPNTIFRLLTPAIPTLGMQATCIQKKAIYS